MFLFSFSVSTEQTDNRLIQLRDLETQRSSYISEDSVFSAAIGRPSSNVVSFGITLHTPNTCTAVRHTAVKTVV